MGLMRFLVHPDELLEDEAALRRGYMTGFDGRNYPTQVELEGNLLLCRREQSESGKLNVPLSIPGSGRLVCTTTSLSERHDPYLLTLELCRGKLSVIRSQVAAWQMLGLTVPAEFDRLEQSAFRKFAQASAAQEDPQAASRTALESLGEAQAAADVLTRAYVQQRLAARDVGAGHPPVLLGARVDAALADDERLLRFQKAFSAGLIPIEWREIESRQGVHDWEPADRLVEICSRHRLILRGGPLIDLGPRGLPEWLSSWRDDLSNLQSFVCNFVETAVARYMGRIRLWEVSARGNSGVALGLSEEHRLALVARTLETAVRTDSDAQLFLRIDQPWSEYQARGQHRLSAFQFVDALVRSNAALHGVILELAVGFRPRGSMMRDMLNVSRLIDDWSRLGVQIHVTLAMPSSNEVDPKGETDLEVDPWNGREPWSPQVQARLARSLTELLIAKPAVTGVFWIHYHDSQPHIYPNAGLVDHHGAPKPALDVLTSLQADSFAASAEHRSSP